MQQLTDHYQEIIDNLRKERESMKLEKEEALARYIFKHLIHFNSNDMLYIH